MLQAVALATPGDGWRAVEPATISELIAAGDALVWAHADVSSLTDADIATIAEELGLHELAVEDALNPRQRPKLEAYEGHLFAVMHQLDEVAGQLEATQLACFVGARWVLTLHAGAERTIAETIRRLAPLIPADGQGSSLIMHAVLDAIVDDYDAIASRLEDEVESIEERALADPRARLQGELYSVKQRLSRLRRYATPGERVLASLLGGSTVGQRTSTYFRDVHDHTLRIIDIIRNVDDLADAVIDLQRAEQATALNEVTKRLTGWAAIIAVPTFIASVYGMNFDLVPAAGEITGFWVALAMMVASSLTLYWYFKRKTWI